jgi:hypothetical protein
MQVGGWNASASSSSRTSLAGRQTIWFVDIVEYSWFDRSYADRCHQFFLIKKKGFFVCLFSFLVFLLVSFFYCLVGFVLSF